VWLIPPKQRPLIRSMWAQLDPVLKRYFIGIAVVVTYASIAAYIGLGLVLGLRNAVLLAILTGLLEMIPVVGPASSAVIAGLAAISGATSIWNIAAYAIYAIALRLSIDQLVAPVVLGRASALPPVLIIFCFLAGGVLFGIPGVILAVPLALTIRIVLATLYEAPLAEPDENEDILA
ncbi:MAG: AI-2E family transporter, partial [Methylocella sp.]